MATFGSGPKIVGMRATREIRLMGEQGPETAVGVSCAAAPGTAFRGTPAPRTATGTSLPTGTTTSASGWPERYVVDLIFFQVSGPKLPVSTRLRLNGAATPARRAGWSIAPARRASR